MHTYLLGRRRFLYLAAAPLLTAPLPGSARPPISVLVVDGINNHDWRAGTAAIKKILEATGKFAVDVSTTPPAGADPGAWGRWHPDFSHYQVVVNNFNGGHLKDGIRWPAPVEQLLTAYLDNGGGLVLFHAANNAFLEWADYNEMIGLGWRDKSFGPGLVIDQNEHVEVVPAGEGLQPGHGPRHDFTMTMLDPRHAITAGMAKYWLHPSEQLTHGQHGCLNPRHGDLEKELHVITCAWSKDSGRNEPMDWLRSWGRGRIYTTMLGHTWVGEDNPNLRCVGFQTLFARGVEWAATGDVSVPVPPDFPTSDSIKTVG
jgi:type 1 glutamine amidotransferase